MEYALLRFVVDATGKRTPSLNPYCNGICSAILHQAWKALRALRLNPYSIGICSAMLEQTIKAIMNES